MKTPLVVATLLSLLLTLGVRAQGDEAIERGSVDRPLDPGSMRAFAEGCKDWDLERLWAAWGRDPHRNPEIDEHVRYICEQSAAHWASTPDVRLSYQNTGERIEYIEQVMRSAPESELLEILLADARAFDDGDWHSEVLAAYHNTHDAEILPIRRLHLAVRAHRRAAGAGDERLTASLGAEIFAAFEEMLASPPADRMRQRYVLLYGEFLAQWATPELDLAVPAMAAVDRTDDPWIALVVAARAHRVIGWNARGRGFANTVDDDAWPVFRWRMAWARPLLVRAHELRPEAPEAAALLIDITKSNSEDLTETYDWFLRVAEAQPTWMPALREFAWALRPRWGGSTDYMTWFAGWIAQHAEPDNELSWYLFRFLGMLMQDTQSSDAHWSYDKLAGSVNLLARNHIERGIKPDLWRERLIGVAWERGEWVRAERLVSQVGPGFWTPFNDFRVHGHDVREDILLRTTDGPRAIGRGMDALERGDFSVAVRFFSEALEDESMAEEVRVALRHRAVSAAWQDEYERTGAIAIHAEPGLPGWRLWQGRMREAGGKVLIGADEGNAWARPAFEPGPRYELSITAEPPEGPGYAWSRVVLNESWLRYQQQWVTVSARWHDSTTRMRYQFTNRQCRPLSDPMKDGRVTYRVVAFDGDLHVSADDRVLYRGPESMGYGDLGLGTGFWLSAWIAGEGRDAAFSDITFRRLDERPRLLNGPATETYDSTD